MIENSIFYFSARGGSPPALISQGDVGHGAFGGLFFSFLPVILFSIFYFLLSCRARYTRAGQSLVEVLIASALGAIFVIAAMTIIAPALKIGGEGENIQVGAALARELLDNARVWAEGDWHRVSALATSSANKYYLVTTASPFASSSGEETLVVGTTTYIRFFYLDDVLRDPAGVIVSAGGSGIATDPSTKKVTVVYKWAPINATNTVSAYITRHRSKLFHQTDWSGGDGQEGPVTSANSRFASSSSIDFSGTPGSIKIQF